MLSNILTRPSFQSAPVSGLQSQVDSLMGGFVAQATDWRSLTAMVAGGLVFRAARVGLLSAAASHTREGQFLFPLITRGGSFVGALGAESATFELTRRGLFSWNDSQGALWRWSGPQGFGQGWAQSAISFGALRTVAPLMAAQNTVLQHLSIDGAMMAGQHLTHLAGLSPSPEGTLAQQFLSAEATNLQMQAGLSLVHGFTEGRIAALERSLDLNLALRARPLFASQAPSSDVREEGMANASGSSRLYSINPLFLLAPKLLVGSVAGYLLSTLRPRAAIGLVLGTGAALVGMDYLSGHDPQWLVDAAVLGGAATYGYLRARSLRGDMQSNPFHTEHDPAYPMRIPIPKEVVVNPRPVHFAESHTQLQIFDRTPEKDGFPKSFIWSVNPPRGLSLFQRFFYRVFDPMRFTFSMGRFARSAVSSLLVRPFSWLKGIDLNRFTFHLGQSRFRSFDEFFTRRLKDVPKFYPGAAPAEGKLLYLARGNLDQVLTIKGERIALRDLMGEEVSKHFSGNVGVMITYLSPRDYHLSHSPVDGRLVDHRRIPGAAWTVGPEIWNEPNIEGKPGSRYLTFNARDVVLKETPYGPLATVYVAATNVYSTEIHPQKGDEVKAGMHEQSYHFGSTNVYVFDADQFYFPEGIHPGQQMTFGKTPFLIPKAEVER